MEVKTLAQHSTFLHEICPLCDTARMHAENFHLLFFPNLPYTASSTVVFLNK